tara:strand:+ start:91 stop:1065 length:975 start_codon:yes stop_codon:yes gene_type:complete
MIIKTNLEHDIEIEGGLVFDNGFPKGFVITDEIMDKLYGDMITNEKYVIKGGEGNKNLDTYAEIMKKLGNFDIKRIIAFGGGVVGDIAGFVASTYKRGVPLIQVPTTFLSMVDSSIGGKNGINLEGKKNYIGTICQPEKVLIDLKFLDSLPEEEFRNGLGEVIKDSVVYGKPSIERMKKGVNKDDEDIIDIVGECCKIKSEVVEKDINDKNIRHSQNFGHTIGHAIELLSGLRHGEAVAIGMVKELKLGEELGIIEKGKSEEVKKILQINKLPFEFPDDFDVKKVFEIMKKDKKGSLVFAFDVDNYDVEVSEEKVKKFLENGRI